MGLVIIHPATTVYLHRSGFMVEKPWRVHRCNSDNPTTTLGDTLSHQLRKLIKPTSVLLSQNYLLISSAELSQFGSILERGDITTFGCERFQPYRCFVFFLHNLYKNKFIFASIDKICSTVQDSPGRDRKLCLPSFSGCVLEDGSNSSGIQPTGSSSILVWGVFFFHFLM